GDVEGDVGRGGVAHAVDGAGDHAGGGLGQDDRVGRVAVLVGVGPEVGGHGQAVEGRVVAEGDLEVGDLVRAGGGDELVREGDVADRRVGADGGFGVAVIVEVHLRAVGGGAGDADAAEGAGRGEAPGHVQCRGADAAGEAAGAGLRAVGGGAGDAVAGVDAAEGVAPGQRDAGRAGAVVHAAGAGLRAVGQGAGGGPAVRAAGGGALGQRLVRRARAVGEAAGPGGRGGAGGGADQPVTGQHAVNVAGVGPD